MKSLRDLSFGYLAAAGAAAAHAANAEAILAGITPARLQGQTDSKTTTQPEPILSDVELTQGMLSPEQSYQKKLKKSAISQRTGEHLVAIPYSSTEDPVVPTLFTLGLKMCKWPIGDPRQDSFTFCGRRSEEGTSYCIEHVKLTVSPSSQRSKRPKKQLTSRAT